MDENMILLLHFPFMAYTWTFTCFTLLCSTLFPLLYFTTLYNPPFAWRVWGNWRNFVRSDREIEPRVSRTQQPCTSSWVLKVHRKR